jgi:hypothetical protein
MHEKESLPSRIYGCEWRTLCWEGWASYIVSKKLVEWRREENVRKEIVRVYYYYYDDMMQWKCTMWVCYGERDL